MKKAANLFRRAEQCRRERVIPEALALYEAAERAGASADACSAGRWECCMLSGRYDEAWKESDLIDRRGAPDPHRFWSGASLAGSRLMIRCLHGLGDTIQYVRYARLLRPIVRYLTIEAQPPLRDLLAQSEVADAVTTWGNEEPEWDEQIEIVELPRIFRSELATLPAIVPYLRTPKAAVLASSLRLRVGVVWASGTYDCRRSVPFDSFVRITQVGGCEFFSFQADPERGVLGGTRTSIEDLYCSSGSILEAAVRLQTMDLVITVDTMLAHLAGAFGLAVWTLLPYAADWRWMVDRADSPWYPTMRLFRQRRAGDWTPVIEDVCAALRSCLSERVVDRAGIREG